MKDGGQEQANAGKYKAWGGREGRKERGGAGHLAKGGPSAKKRNKGVGTNQNAQMGGVAYKKKRDNQGHKLGLVEKGIENSNSNCRPWNPGG